MKLLSTFRAKRRLTARIQSVIVLGLPFVRIDGESALRFDVPSLKLYFFGSVIWISEAYFFLLVSLLFFIGVMLFTMLYGRIWCGWACPQTVLSDFSRRIAAMARWLTGHRALSMVLTQFFILAFSIVVSAGLIWYFVSPYDMAKDIFSRSLGPWTLWSWIFFAALAYLNLAFVRQKLCTSVCPYARFQSAFFDHKTLTIGFDGDRSHECRGCEACVKACPAEIDIRNGLQVECINCAECIDACAGRMKRLHKRGLIGYFFGRVDRDVKQTARPRVIGLAVAFAVIAALFIHQIYVRVPVDFLVIRDESRPYHQTGFKGDMLNTYSLFVENRSLEPEEYLLGLSGVEDAELVIPRNPFTLPPNAMVKFTIYVFARRSSLRERITRLQFTLKSTRSSEIRITREAPFLYPERTEKGVEI